MRTLKEVLLEVRTAPEFYVYVLYKPNGVPFYVGKGFGDRLADHEMDASRQTPYSKNKLKINTIRKIWKSDKDVLYVVDSKHLNEQDAHNREVDLIAQIGRKCTKEGPLTNITAGGEGFKDIPKFLKIQISEALKKYYEDPQNIEIHSIAAKQYFINNPDAVEQARQNAIKNKSHENLIQWMKNNPELYVEKQKRHSKEMKVWHATNRKRTKEIAAKRNEKFRTIEHRLHMSEKTKEFIANNPEKDKIRRQAVVETKEEKSKIWQECLELLRQRLISEGKLRKSVSRITNKSLYKLKKRGIVSANIPNGFSSIETLKTCRRSLIKA